MLKLKYLAYLLLLAQQILVLYLDKIEPFWQRLLQSESPIHMLEISKEPIQIIFGVSSNMLLYMYRVLLLISMIHIKKDEFNISFK